MTRKRWRFGVGLALVALFMAACGATAVTPSPTVELTPVPGAVSAAPRASEVPLDEAWNGKTLQDAIAAIGDLSSYQFVASSQLGRISGTVINGAKPRYSVETGAIMGSPPVQMIVIGADMFISYGGGRWSHESGGGGGMGMPSPVTSMLPSGFSDLSGDPATSMYVLPAFVDLGIESHDGVEARHLHAIGNGRAPAPSQSVSPDDFPMGGPAFRGTIDAWVAVDGGYLSALNVTGRWIEPDFPDLEPTPSPDFQFPIDFDSANGELSLRAVNDPSNVVEAPEIPPATPKPSGDPKVIALINGIGAANEKLPAYSLRITTGAGAVGVDVTAVVAKGPPRRMRMTMDFSSMGFKSELIVIGDKGWQREQDGGWVDVPADELGGCFSGLPGDSCGDLTGLSGVGALGFTSEPESFERLPGREIIEGIQTIHLRSTAGYTMADQSVPGTTDLWVAVDGGWLVRQKFTSDFMTVQTDIRALGDKDVKVVRPVP